MKTNAAKPKRIFIVYARFSPRPDANNCESIETQTELARSYVAKKGGEILKICADPDMSGADHERPGLWEAMDALKPGYTLLVWKTDRLVREVYLAEKLFREIAEKRARFETIETGEITQSPHDKLVRGILTHFDQYIREIGNYRTSLSMRRHQKNDRAMSAYPPYGKRRAADCPVTREGVETMQRRWEDDPEEMAIVERILQESAAGLSHYAIAEGLNRDGIPARGERWYKKSVARICLRAASETAYARAN